MLRSGLLILLIVLSAGSIAQEVTNINPAIKVIGGEAFYLHDVLEGQEIEAIAEAYSAVIRDIVIANPTIRRGLQPGMKLLIPFTVESSDKMSNLPFPEVQASREEIEAKAEQKAMEKKANPDKIDESELAALMQLSQSISESLNELKSAEKTLEDIDEMESGERPFENVSKVPVGNRGTSLSRLLELSIDSLIFSTEADTTMSIKEYFLIRMNRDGVITNVRDERTKTNVNTHFLPLDSIKGYLIPDTTDQLFGRISHIGLNANIKRTKYEVKVKKKKIRIYKTKFFLEFLPADHPHYQLIREAADQNGTKGKSEADIIEFEQYISVHKKVEYNPFGIEERRIDFQHYVSLERFQP